MTPHPMFQREKLSYLDKIHLVYGVFGKNDLFFLNKCIRAAERGVDLLAEVSGAQEMLEILEQKLYELKVFIRKEDTDMWSAILGDEQAYGRSYAMVVYNAAVKFIEEA
jgi:hypothetical protein